MTPGLTKLSREVSAILDLGDDDLLPEALCPVLREALKDPGLLPDSVVLDRPASGFGKHLLRTGPDFCIFATLTAPGVSLPVHDHGSWGVVGVYRGIEEEIRYEPSSQILPGEPMLLEVGRVVHSAGDVTAVRPPPSDIHAVANGGLEWSICVHLFAEDPMAHGFNCYQPPGYRPHHTGRLAYDSTLGAR